MVGSRSRRNEENPTGSPERPLNAADVFVFAPIGLVIRASQLLPGAIQSGKAEYEKRAATAQLLGRFIVAQQRRKRQLAAVSAAAAARPQAQIGNALVDSSVDTPVSAAEVGSTKVRTPGDSPSTAVSNSPADSQIDLPIDGYDTMPARSLLALFDGLTTDQINTVRRHELANRRRETVLTRLAQLQQAAELGEDD